MRRAAIAGLIGVAVAAVALAATLWLPIGRAFDPPRSSPEAVDGFEARTSEHFGRIEQAASAGGGLALPFPPMPTRDENPITPAKVELGRLLYFDPILSGDDTLSCAHCHHPDLGLSDGRGRSMGRGGVGVGVERVGGAVLRRGSPTVWNAAYQHAQFWDGRARDLEEQAAKPIFDPNEMAEEGDRLIAQLRSVPEYVERFDAVFGEPDAIGSGLSFRNVVFAIAAFERTLVSNDSRFDRYARGQRGALSAKERRGLNVFRSLETRCFECHNLPTFANRDFKVIGVPEVEGGPGPVPDLGRGEIEAGAAYARAFKVPTLRNIALTAPYMHNGSFDTLSEVIDFYAGGGGTGAGVELPNLDDKIRPFSLDPQEKADLIAFLHALTDESAKPAIPQRVPSGLPVVPALANRSPMLASIEPSAAPVRPSVIRRHGQRLVVEPGQRIQDAIDQARPGDVIEVMPGTYHETLTLDVVDLTLDGRPDPDGERAVLDGRGVLSDGAVGSASNLEIRGFEVRDYTANGLMINLGANITFRDLKLVNTGLYGVYPVEVVGVLIEDCEVTGSRDAGIYVGQSRDIVVRHNVAWGNVTGIEIENSIHALVENNHVYDNTGGILVFGLPNNPSKVARDCRVIDNRVIGNNHENFADPTAVVAGVPAGTGILVLAADDTEVAGNTIVGHRSFGVAVASLDMLFPAGSTYDMDPFPDRVWVHDNTFVAAGVERNGFDADRPVVEAGFSGADLLWDLTGEGHRWDEEGVTRLPPALPASDWPTWQRRANTRLWRWLMEWAP